MCNGNSQSYLVTVMAKAHQMDHRICQSISEPGINSLVVWPMKVWGKVLGSYPGKPMW